VSYEERRVLVKTYGTLPRSSQLLVQVAGTCGPMRLHTLAAEGLSALAKAVRSDLKIDLKIASGWRPHRWRSRAHYEATVLERYSSLSEGRRFLAYSSPHETGLAIDLGVGGLAPDRRTIEEQRRSKLHRWMVEHAFKFGWHPYKVEPWHWEYPLSVKAWKTGIRDDDEVVLLDDDEGAEEDELWDEQEG